MFDVAVVGLGMIGSAALRYLSKPETQFKVVGIGPAEPSADWRQHQGAFASHYDQARITRITDPDPIWAALAERSLACYAEIEQHSGITFHHPVGQLRISATPDAADDSLDEAERAGRALDADFVRLTRAQLVAQFPDLRFAPQAVGLWERGGAGFINPRNLVAAQLKLAATQGATLVRDEVVGLRRDGDQFALATRAGQTIRAARVLVSTHGYTNFWLQSFLQQRLALVNRPHTTVYAELAPARAQGFMRLPTLIWRLDGHPVLPSIYSTPATTYADGRVYFKIGGPLYAYPPLETEAQILEWFHGEGNPVEIKALQEVLCDLIPNLPVIGWSSKPCMNTYTPHDHPFIAQLAEGLFVCTGGCGSAAKSSNEIGRMCAMLAQHEQWRCDLPAHEFRVMYTS